MITKEQLVNVHGSSYWRNLTDSTAAIQRIVQVANVRRPKEIEDFVQALTRMFERIGMHGVCRLCFKGVLFDYKPAGKGCCGECPLLTATACANKPMGCATFMCSFTSNLFPRTREFQEVLSRKVFGYKFHMGCFDTSVERESQFQLSESQKRRLRWAIRKLDAWQEKAV